MNTVKIALSMWRGTKTYMEAKKIIEPDHRGKLQTTYKVISRHTFTKSGLEIITDTDKNTVYYPCDIILIDK